MIKRNESVEDNAVYIYTLSGPDGMPFYIGKTNNPAKRYAGHLSEKSRGANKAKAALIQSVIGAGGEITMTIMDSCSAAEWQERETYWITKYKYDWQVPLVNICDGGNGVDFTEAVRQKMSAARKGKSLSEETRAKMKGRKAHNQGSVRVDLPKVVQCDLQGRPIQTFDNIRKAGESLGFNRGCISLCVNGKRLTYKGFTFRYEL